MQIHYGTVHNFSCVWYQPTAEVYVNTYNFTDQFRPFLYRHKVMAFLINESLLSSFWMFFCATEISLQWQSSCKYLFISAYKWCEKTKFVWLKILENSGYLLLSDKTTWGMFFLFWKHLFLLFSCAVGNVWYHDAQFGFCNIFLICVLSVVTFTVKFPQVITAFARDHWQNLLEESNSIFYVPPSRWSLTLFNIITMKWRLNAQSRDKLDLRT